MVDSLPCLVLNYTRALFIAGYSRTICVTFKHLRERVRDFFLCLLRTSEQQKPVIYRLNAEALLPANEKLCRVREFTPQRFHYSISSLLLLLGNDCVGIHHLEQVFLRERR